MTKIFHGEACLSKKGGGFKSIEEVVKNGQPKRQNNWNSGDIKGSYWTPNLMTAYLFGFGQTGLILKKLGEQGKYLELKDKVGIAILVLDKERSGIEFTIRSGNPFTCKDVPAEELEAVYFIPRPGSGEVSDLTCAYARGRKPGLKNLLEKQKLA